MSRRRFWLLAGCVSLLLFLGLLAGGWLALRAYAPALTREQVAAGLSRALGSPVTVAEVRLNPWLGRLVLREVAAEPWLRVGRVELRVGLRSLWRRELVISRLRLERPALRLTPAPESAPLASFLPPSRLTLGPVTATLDRLEVSDGALSYLESGGLGVDLAGVEGTAELSPEWADLRLRAASARLRRGQIDETLARLEGEGRLTADRVAIRRLAGRWGEHPLALSGELSPLRRPVAFTLSLQGEAELARVARLAGLSFPLAGLVSARGELSGDLDRIRISGRAACPALTLGALYARAVAVEGRYADGSWSLDRVEGRALDGEVRGGLRFSPARPAETRLRAVLRRVQLAALGKLLPLPAGLTGRLDGEAELTGDPRRPETLQGPLRLEAAELRLPAPAARLGAGAVTARGRLAGGGLTLEASTARFPGLELAGQGGLSPAGPRDLHLQGEVDLGAALAPWGERRLAGRVSLAARASGSWERPDLSGRLQAGRLEVAGTRLDRVAVPFRLSGSSLELEPTLRYGRLELAASGSLSWPTPWPAGGLDPARDLGFRLAVRAPGLSWEALDAWLPEAARGRGRLSLEGTLAGTPGRWEGAARLAAEALTGPRGIPLRAVSATLSLDPRRLRVDDLRAAAQGVPLRGRGEWGWDGAGAATAELGPAELAELPGAPDWLQGKARGQVRLATRAGGVEASGSLSAEKATLRGIAVGAAHLQASLRGEALEARLELPALPLTGSLQGRLDAGEPLRVRLQAKQMALWPILRQLLPPESAPVEGSLTATAELAVPAADPARLRGTLEAETLRLAVAGERWENRGPLRLRWEAGRLLVERLELGSRVGEASASGSLDPSGRLDLEARGRVPLGLLPGLVPAIREAEGLLELRLHLGGSVAAPSLLGQGTLRAGRVRLADVADSLREVEAAFTLTPRAVRLSAASAIWGRSRLRATGDLLLEGWRPGPYRLSLVGQEVPFTPLEGLQSLWSLELELAGRGSAATLRGQGHLVRGTYTGDISLLGMLLRRRTGGAGPAAGPAIPLQLSLQLDDNLQVRTNLAQMRMGGHLLVEGTSAAPVLFGTLESRGGRILFRRHRFTVQQATARFSDPRAIDPILSLAATAKIGDYDVTLALRGPVRDLTIRLSSSPALTQEKIVGLLATGSTQSAAGQAAQGLLLEELGQLLVRDILGIVGLPSGLGRFQAGMTEEEGSKRFQVGTQLGENVRILYWQALSGGSQQGLRLEYQLLGPLFLTGEQNFQGGYGGDLLLRLRFR